MPLDRYQIRSEYSLANPDLYRIADKDDPGAVLDGVAMAALIGILRQLGDIAEFAAEIFHDLHGEVMETASRGHGLMARVCQLEADFPKIEKAFLSQTDHTIFFHNTGVDWHPKLRMDQNLIIQLDLPRFVLDSYEECRAPPKLFQLDKFDVAGAGACLKRYTDPSFYRVETACSGMMNLQNQREKKTRKRGSRGRNGEVPEVIPSSRAKLQELLFEERIRNRNSGPACHVKLKRRHSNGSQFDSKTKKSYMEKFLENPLQGQKSNSGDAVGVLSSDQALSNTYHSVQEIVEISTVTGMEEQLWRKKITLSSLNRGETESKLYMEDLNEESTNEEILDVPEQNTEYVVNEIPFIHKMVDNKEFLDLGVRKKGDNINNYHSESLTSKVGNYADGFQPVDSDRETDSDYRPNNKRVEKHGSDSDTYVGTTELQSQFSGSQSTVSSGTSSIYSKKGRFSHSQSDTFSSLAENVLSDGDGEADLLPSSGYAAESVCTSFEQLSVSGDIARAKSHELAVVHPTGIEVLGIPTYRSDSGQASCNSHQLKAIGVDNLQIISQVPINSFDVNDFSLSQASSETHPVGELQDGNDSNKVIQDTMLHKPDVPDLLQKLEDQMALSECASDSFHSNLGNESNTFSLTPDEEWSQGLPRLEVCSKLVLESDGIDSEGYPGSPAGDSMENITSVLENEVNTFPVAEPDAKNLTAVVKHKLDATSESGVNAENFVTEVDTLQHCDFSDSHLSDIKDDVSLLKDVSEFDVQHSAAQVNFGDFVDCENGESTKDIDRLGNYDNSVEFPPYYSKDCNVEEHLQMANIRAETVQGKAVVGDGAASTTNARGDNDNDVICPSSDLICSPLRNCRDSWDTLSISGNSFKNPKIEEPFPDTSLTESETQKEVKQLATGSTYLTVISSNAGHNDDSNSVLDDTFHIFLAEGTQRVHPGDVDIPLSYSYQVEQGLEISPTNRKRHTMSSIEYPMYLATHHLPQQKIPLEKVLELQVDQSYLDQKQLNSMLCNDQVQYINPWNHLDQERCDGLPSESCLEDISIQPSAAKIMQQSPDQKPEISKEPSNPIQLIFPGFDQLPVACPVNPIDTILLPIPLKPWRTGKLQEIAKPLAEDSTNHGMDLSSGLIPSTMADENAQFGFVERKFSEHRSPFLQPSTEEGKRQSDNVSGCSSDDCQHDFCTSERMALPNPYFESPPICNEMHYLGYLDSGREVAQNSSTFATAQLIRGPNHKLRHTSSLEGKAIQNLNQLGPETHLDIEKHQLNFETLEGDMVNSPEASVLRLTQAQQFNISEGEKPNGKSLINISRNQDPLIEEEASLENDRRQEIFRSSEGNMVNTTNAILLPITESEKLKAAEVESPKKKPFKKLLRPQVPLIQAVAAHDKSKMDIQLKTSVARVRPEVVQRINLRDVVLEQIRNKSFNLRPAAPKARPSFTGPRSTNLKVAAILEKVNAIRQAVGSDDDDDSCWSDS